MAGSPTCARLQRVDRSQFATGSQKHRDPRFPPLTFTEHGATMAAMVLNSPRAVEMSVYVVRAFIRLREALASNAGLARQLAAVERSVATLDAGTRRQFEEVYRTLRALMTPPPGKRRARIPFNGIPVPLVSRRTTTAWSPWCSMRRAS